MNSVKYFDMTLREANSVTNIFQKKKKKKKKKRFPFLPNVLLALSLGTLFKPQSSMAPRSCSSRNLTRPTRSVAHPFWGPPVRSVAHPFWGVGALRRSPEGQDTPTPHVRDMPMTGRPGTLYIKILPPDRERKPGGVLTAQRLNQRVVWLLPRESLSCLSLAPP